jgi:hypothetical protein
MMKRMTAGLVLLSAACAAHVKDPTPMINNYTSDPLLVPIVVVDDRDEDQSDPRFPLSPSQSRS